MTTMHELLLELLGFPRLANLDPVLLDLLLPVLDLGFPVLMRALLPDSDESFSLLLPFLSGHTSLDLEPELSGELHPWVLSPATSSSFEVRTVRIGVLRS